MLAAGARRLSSTPAWPSQLIGSITTADLGFKTGPTRDQKIWREDKVHDQAAPVERPRAVVGRRRGVWTDGWRPQPWPLRAFSLLSVSLLSWQASRRMRSKRDIEPAHMKVTLAREVWQKEWEAPKAPPPDPREAQPVTQVIKLCRIYHE